jgi:hypothetical protein
MNSTSLAAALMGAVLLAGAPAIALSEEATTPSPIRLDNVEIERSYGWAHQLFPGLVSVDFTNTTPVAVQEVDFVLEHADGGYIRRYKDVGPFSPGESLKHSFSDAHISEGQKLVVDTVTFADGTTWSAPDSYPATKLPVIDPSE